MVVHIVVGLLAALSLVFYATSLQAGSGSTMEEMLRAQRTAPLLWLVDACGVGIVFAMGFFATMLTHFQGYIDHQAQEHQQQLTAMIEHTEELQKTSDAYAERMDTLEEEFYRQKRDYRDQIATLEAAAAARRDVYEVEARSASQQGLLDLQSQVEANTRQLEAMNLALQFQRGELRKLRQELRSQGFSFEPPSPLSGESRPSRLLASQASHETSAHPEAAAPEPASGEEAAFFPQDEPESDPEATLAFPAAPVAAGGPLHG